MSKVLTWRTALNEMHPEQQGVVLGGSLSQRFAAWPLWANHPSYIGGLYGLLITLALAFPIGYKTGWDSTTWGITLFYQGVFIIFACSFLGFCSRIMMSIFKRPPMEVPRTILYLMPFVGLAWLTLIITGLFQTTSSIAWMLIIIPGPIYVHVTWAPRWRYLTMLESGDDPFGGKRIQIQEDADIAGGDDELLNVVETFESTNGEEE